MIGNGAEIRPLEMGRKGPEISTQRRFRIASRLKLIYGNCARVKSLAQWLENWSGSVAIWVLFQAMGREIFQLSFTLIAASCHESFWLFCSVARALFLYWSGPDWILSHGAGIFSAMLYTCCSFCTVRWRLIRDWTSVDQIWLFIIINDDFLEEGKYYH